MPNYPAISFTTMQGWPVLGFGVVLLGVCVVCVLIWQGVIEGEANAPLWVIGVVGVVFGVGGLLLAAYGISDLRDRARRTRELLTHPSETWRGDHDWSRALAGRGMPSRDSGRWWVHALGLALLLSMGVISNWIATIESGNGIGGWFTLMMAVIMDLIVLLVLGLAVRRLLMRWRYGSPRIVFDRVPVRPGETLKARVVTRGLGRVDRLVVTLRYVVEVYVKSKTSDGKTKEEVVCKEHYHERWETDDVGAHLSGDGVLPVEFEIPGSAEPCVLRERPARFWDLEVRGEVRGVDFVHRFTVPVYGDQDAG